MPISELVIFIIVKAALAVVIFALWMTMVPVMIWVERKVIADIQARLGPNRVGPFGIIQPIADAVKLIFKEDILPKSADKIVYALAPAMLMVPAVLAISVIPIGGTVTIGSRSFALQILGAYKSPGLTVPELDAGILLVIAFSSLGVYGVALSGWASGSKYSLLGGMRSSAQMLSYELPLGVSLLGPIVLAGSLKLTNITNAQKDMGIWFVLPQLTAFVVFFISGLSETNRAPFDLPEAEQELIGGYHTEYSGFRFAMFFMAEYLSMVTISALAVTFFLGGWRMPFIDIVWLGPVWFAAKVMAMLYIFVWVRGTLPRVRYDQLMRIGWKAMLPIAAINVIFTAAIVTWMPNAGAAYLSAAGVGFAVLTFAFVSMVLKRNIGRSVDERLKRVLGRGQEAFR